MATSKHHLTRAERADLRASQIERRAAYGMVCPSASKTIPTKCGHDVTVPLYCGRRDCPICSRIASHENNERYEDGLLQWQYPKLITTTERSQHNLEKAFTDHATHRHSLLNTRIGERARNALRDAHERYITVTHDSGKPRFDTAKIDELRHSAARFFTQLAAAEVVYKTHHPRGQFRFRHLFDEGLLSVEITHSKHGWHVHSHIAVNCDLYIPQSILSLMWSQATNGDGFICDIRTLKDKGGKSWVTEVLKYATKPGSIPIEFSDELHTATSGKQFIKPMGDLKPKEVTPTCEHCGCATHKPKICPTCYKPTKATQTRTDVCTCHYDLCTRNQDHAITLTRNLLVSAGTYLVRHDDVPLLATLTRDGGHLRYSERRITEHEYAVFERDVLQRAALVTQARSELWRLVRQSQTAEVTARRVTLTNDVLRYSITGWYQVKDTTADELSPVLDPFELDEVMQT